MEGVVGPDFWHGRRVFLTGHTGFKGSWLSLWLSELGAQVYGYALKPPTQPSLFVEAAVEPRLAGHTEGDVGNLRRLQGVLAEVRPEIVFHLAAQPLVRLSYEEPVATYATNVMGTVNLLEAVRHSDSVRVCQVITSDKSYENREWIYPYREPDPMGGHDPYSSSKGCAELVVSAYRSSFFDPERIDGHGVSLASARSGNVIGGGDWAEDRIIPDCMRSLTTGKTVEVRHPHAVRPWQHVLDVLSGYLSLAARQWGEPGRYAGAWNFGPVSLGRVTVEEVVRRLIAHWGEGSWRTQADDPEGVHEACLLKLDVTKATERLHWRPLYSIDDAVHATVQWYRARNDQGPGMVPDFTLDQIAQYQEDGRRQANAATEPGTSNGSRPSA